MSQTSKVDKILQEIYLEMELEEIDDLLEEAENVEFLSEEGASQVMGRMSRAQSLMLDKIAAARKAGNSDLVKTLTAKLSSIKAALSKLKAGAGKMAGQAMEKGAEYASKGKEMATSAGKSVAAGAKTAMAKGSEYAGKAKDIAMQNPEAAAAAAAVAAVAAGVVIYKKFFSQAAKACKGKSGSDKSNCVTSFKIKGLQAAKAKVASGISKCKSPKCKAKLQAKVQGFDAKISAMKGKVSESVINGYVGDYLSELKN